MNKQLIAYILIFMVFLGVFGGVVSILPSRRAREIGNLRVTARKYGIETSLVQIADVNASLADRVTAGGVKREPKKRCIAWSKRYPDEFPDVPQWITYALKQNDPTRSNWQLHSTPEKANNLTDTYWREVSRIKARFPERCIAIECTRSEVRWLGYENISTTSVEFLEAMVQGLDELIQLNILISHENTTSNTQLGTSSEYD